MRHYSPAAFADDVRMRHFFGVTNIGDIVNDVVGVFLEGVIGGAVECGPAAVVIHTQTSADIQELDRKAHFLQLGVEAGRFLHRPLDDEDVRHL